MSLSALAVDDTPAILTDTTPFARGFNVVVLNTSAGSLTLQGSDNGTDYTTLATVPAGAAQTVVLPVHSVKVSTAATLYLLG